MEMKIQLLYFPGCPNVEATREVLRRSLRACGVPSPFEEIDITAPETPEPLRAWGSPTILVEGQDIAGERPAGSSCRLYRGAPGPRPGVPPEAMIRAAIERSRPPRRELTRSLSVLPGALLALLPAATCPACVAAYAGVVSALGLGFLLTERVLAPLIVGFLAASLVSVGWSARGHRRLGPLITTAAGSAAVVLGRLIWSVPLLVYGGVALLLGASLWNLWLKRPRPQPPIQIRMERKEGATS
jgi:hypothetical protein